MYYLKNVSPFINQENPKANNDVVSKIKVQLAQFFTKGILPNAVKFAKAIRAMEIKIIRPQTL